MTDNAHDRQTMCAAILESHAQIAAVGPDCRALLQRLLTCDLTDLRPPALTYGGLLSPQGKLLFDFLIFVRAGSYILDLPSSLAEPCIRRLSMYRLRAQVDIRLHEEALKCVVFWGGEDEKPACIAAGDGDDIQRDPRLPRAGYRALVPMARIDEWRTCPALHFVDEQAWHAHRIAIALPEAGQDFASGGYFAHDVNMDLLGGISMHKGCFIGQEVVSRVHHRGAPRRRIARFTATGPVTQGAEIRADDRPVGHVGSRYGMCGLAVIRVDQVKKAQESGAAIMCEDQLLEIELPAGRSV